MIASASPPRTGLSASILVTLGMAFTVGSALAFEHIGGYIPCALCLLQRDPYYYGIPLGILAVLSALFRLPAWTTRGLLLVIGILMLVGAGLGVYHSGVEWHFWAGPSACSTAAQGVTTNAGDLLGELNSKKPPSCDAASLRVLGLSFAGWNVIASLVIAAISLKGAAGRR